MFKEKNNDKKRSECFWVDNYVKLMMNGWLNRRKEGGGGLAEGSISQNGGIIFGTSTITVQQNHIFTAA